MISVNFLDKEIKHRYPPTDIGTSNLFIDSFKDELLYCADSDLWYVWNGKVWEIDCMLKRNEMIKKLAFYCKHVIFTKADDDQKQKLLEYYNKLNDKTFRDKIIKDSMSIAPVKATIFNKEKYLFNCRNGTYDFITKQFREHDRKDYITDLANVKYDPSADCPRFEQYLSEVMQNDTEKIDYLMKIAAYCLTGDTSRECFFILYGDKTRNGKGTFVSTMTHIAGTYAQTLRPAAITRKNINTTSSNATPEIAKLVNARMVNVNELEDGMMLDVALMKTLTGGDTMSARHLYKEEFDYIPKFKIVINTNVLPRMTDDSIFNSDRIHILSFDKHFELAERDTGLKDKLKREASGIFNWILLYWDKLQREGFKIPKQSEKVIEEYHLASNNIMAYTQERLYEDSNTYEKVKDIYDDYDWWCGENGYYAVGKKIFKERIARLGALFTGKERHKNRNGESENTFWMRGYSLIPPKPKTQNYAEQCNFMHIPKSEIEGIFTDETDGKTDKKQEKQAGTNAETGGTNSNGHAEKAEKIKTQEKTPKNTAENENAIVDNLPQIVDNLPY